MVTGSPDAPAPRKGGRPRNATIDRAVVEAALDLLVEGGVRAVSIDAVARRTGTTRAAIYRRWKNADDLLWSAMDFAMMAAAGRTNLSGPYSTDGLAFEAALRQILKRTVDVFSDRRFAASYLAMVAAARENPAVRQGLDRYRARSAQTLATVMATAMGSVGAPAAVVADLIVGVAVTKVLIEDVRPSAETIEAWADIVSAGARAWKAR